MNQETKTLKCACCGAYTIGRQFNNQDLGWGLCNGCVVWIRSRKNYNAEEFERTYGKPGFHYSVGLSAS